MVRIAVTLLWLVATVSATADEPRYLFVQGDRVEYQSDADRTAWDLQGWYGGDLHKLWLKIEGKNEPQQDNELQLLYSRAVSPYFDLQFGLRAHEVAGSSTASGVFGVQGLAAYKIEIDAAVFFTVDGDVEFRGEFERDFRLAQRVVMQPRIELNASSTAADDAAVELRLRYEISRKLAPYVGLSWQRHFDDNLPDNTSSNFVAGLRFWF